MFRIQDKNGQMINVKMDKGDPNLLWMEFEDKTDNCNLGSISRSKLQEDVRNGMYIMIK